MTSDVKTLNLYVWFEEAGGKSVWLAQVPEIRLSAAGASRGEVIALVRHSLEIEFPGESHHLEIHDCLAPA